MNMKKFLNHTFVICAYKESEYLESCIQSLVNQTVKSNIIISTSTPNEYISKMAEKYNLQLYINNGETGIGQDWNFGISQTQTDYITIAHQDDIYDKEYLSEVVGKIEKYGDFVIAFTKYKEIKNDKIIKLTRNLKIKEIFLLSLKTFNKSKLIKKFILSFGSTICCPSVTINTRITGKNPYITQMKCDLDWDTWVDMIQYKGRYVYIDKYLVNHRIHENSETSNLIENNIRLKEDLIMFEKIWPKPIAKFIMYFYKNAIKTNIKEEV